MEEEFDEEFDDGSGSDIDYFGAYNGVLSEEDEEEDDIFQNENVGKWVNQWKTRSKETIKKFKEGISELYSDLKKGQEIINNSQLTFPSALTYRHYILYAHRLQISSNNEEALIVYQKLLKFKDITKKGLIEANFSIALLYSQINPEEAIKYYEKTLSIDPTNVEVLMGYSNYLINIGENEKGKEILKNAIKIAPNEEDIYQHLASRFTFEERYDEAIKVLEQIRWTNNPYILNDMAFIYSKLDRFEEAISCYRRALQIDDGLNETRYRYAQLLIVLKRYEEAIEVCKIIIEIESDFYEAYDALALSHFNINNYQDSIDIWENLIGMEYESFNTRADIGLAYIKLKNYKKAEEIIRISLEKNASYPLFAYGIALYKLGKYQSAIDYFNRALNFDFSETDDENDDCNNDELILSQSLDDLHCYYAKCLMKLNGSEKEIFDHLNLSIKANPEYSKAYYRLAQMYLKINPPDIENAKSNFKLAIEKNKIVTPLSFRFSDRVVTKIIETITSL